MVERLHRHLKNAIRYLESDSWVNMLPIEFLLGIRAAWKEDLGATPADLVFGEPLRLPGEFLASLPPRELPPTNIADRLRNHFADLAPQPIARHGQRKVFVFKELANCSHVLVRRDAPHHAFTSPYEGPHQVISRHEKHFVIRIRGENTVVSIDRLKPVFSLPDDEHNNDDEANDDSHDSNTTLTAPPSPESPQPGTSRRSSSYRPSDTGSSTSSIQKRVRFAKRHQLFSTNRYY
ncbi:uncharacterized protein LOC107039697 [Diachasma alloeum]|uniref:uncharacterized protein LOC107039697 n=1 Tax=Diachasma alloeum TaxID=454923 RepID=UPI0007384331|nr:uncharacterized protein LOC107039697 [Diachasma alloeum]